MKQMRLFQDKVTGLLGMSSRKKKKGEHEEALDEESLSNSSSDSEFEYVTTGLITGTLANISEVVLETLDAP